EPTVKYKLPSGPVTICCGSACAASAYSLITPLISMRPILAAPASTDVSTNQTAPSGPVVIPWGTLAAPLVMANSAKLTCADETDGNAASKNKLAAVAMPTPKVRPVRCTDEHLVI